MVESTEMIDKATSFSEICKVELLRTRLKVAAANFSYKRALIR